MARLEDWKTTFTHEGTEYGITERGKFQFKISDDGEVEEHDTMDATKEAIHSANLASRSTVDLGITVMLSDGQEVKMRRIHAGTGKWMTNPEPKTTRVGQAVPMNEVYWPSRENLVLLTEQASLQQKLRKITVDLGHRAVKLSSPSYSGPGGDKNSAIINLQDAFVQEFAARDPDTHHGFDHGYGRNISEFKPGEGGTCRCGQERLHEIHDEHAEIHPHPTSREEARNHAGAE